MIDRAIIWRYGCVHEDLASVSILRSRSSVNELPSIFYQAILGSAALHLTSITLRRIQHSSPCKKLDFNCEATHSISFNQLKLRFVCYNYIRIGRVRKQAVFSRLTHLSALKACLQKLARIIIAFLVWYPPLEKRHSSCLN